MNYTKFGKELLHGLKQVKNDQSLLLFLEMVETITSYVNYYKDDREMLKIGENEFDLQKLENLDDNYDGERFFLELDIIWKNEEKIPFSGVTIGLFEK